MKQLSQDELMSFSQAVGKLLQEKQFMLASAESCTGGLIGHLITEVSGSSAYFAGGAVIVWLCTPGIFDFKLVGGTTTFSAAWKEMHFSRYSETKYSEQAIFASGVRVGLFLVFSTSPAEPLG